MAPPVISASVSVPFAALMNKQQLDELARFFLNMAKWVKDDPTSIPGVTTVDWYWVKAAPLA